MEMSRRDFAGAMGAFGGVLVAANAVRFVDAAEPSKAADASAASDSTAQDAGETPWWAVSKYPGETVKNPEPAPVVSAPAPEVLTPEEVDEFLNNEVTVTEDYVKPDGTVVPAGFVNMRNKVNRNGVGIGSKITTGDEFDVWGELVTAEEAGWYGELPQYVQFTAADYALKSGRSEEECAQICETLTEKAVLRRVTRAGVNYYNTQSQEYGIYEAEVMNFTKEYLDAKDAGKTPDFSRGFVDAGTPMYRSYPVDLSVVEGEYTPFDDWHAIIERNETFSVSPCMCRMKQAMQGKREIVADDELDCGHPIETCLCTGEQAEYILSIGAGRELTKDEARALLERSVDEGLVIESVYTRTGENICSCHSDCCLNIGGIRALNGGPSVENYSNFYLKHDTDACLKCGACVDRCPMRSITMSEETGLPIVDAACVRCGQCALICPASARKLVLKPEEDRPYIPHTLVEDYEAKARVRAAKGYLYDFVG